MKQANISLHIKQIDQFTFTSAVTVYCGEQRLIVDVFTFENSHAIYAAYKTLMRVLYRLKRRDDVGAVTIETNLPQLVEELGGKLNVNTRLYNLLKQVLNETEIEITGVKLRQA